VLGRHEGNELVAHVDEGLILAPAAQGEIEDLAVEGQGLLDVSHFERDVIDADQLGPCPVRLLCHGFSSCRRFLLKWRCGREKSRVWGSPVAPRRSNAPSPWFRRRGGIG